ncbi:MAG: hypothetical protein K2P84_03320 [Undibacterium sp.]|nr:hypothetical protein [Undibacterium sp.]
MRTHKKQTGFVLAVSMIFLIIMTVLAVTAIKKGTMDEKVAGNLRAQNVAFQAAEKALRFCESKIELRMNQTKICQIKDATTLYNDNATFPQFPNGWSTKSNWDNPPTITLSGFDLDVNLPAQPQCMIEKWTFRAEEGVEKYGWVITSRAAGNVNTAVVTLQEVIRCGNY